MEPHFGLESRSSMPALEAGPFGPGQPVYDEGVFMCVRCGLPGSEASLLPGDETPECPRCGEDARWVKT